jgi:hypothetical protein
MACLNLPGKISLKLVMKWLKINDTVQFQNFQLFGTEDIGTENRKS